MDIQQFNQLCENIRTSHSDLNYATETPFYVVQQRKTDYFKNKDSFSYTVWVDNDNEVEFIDYDPEMFNHLSVYDRKELNDKSFEIHKELFDRIDEKHQNELLKDQLSFRDESGDLSIRYCSDYWEDISWHITHQSAEKFLENKNTKDFRIYAYSLHKCFELKAIVQLLKENKLTLVETPEPQETEQGE